jgi:cysteine desulfurase
VLHGCLAAGDRLVVSALEHPSVSRAAEALSRRGILLERLGVDSTGRVRADVPFSGARLISVMLASNETGVIQPVAQLAMRAREAGTLVHTDAVQAVGKIPVDFGALGVDAMTVAPHKFHGPIGIGALVVRREAALEPAMAGGFQQEGLRPGTEGVALAVGFPAALRLVVGELPARAAHIETLRDDLERRLAREIDEVVVLGGEAPRLPGTACLAFPGVDRQQMMMALDLSGVACSTGSACASGSSEPSAALVAMGLPERVISSAVRFSLGATTTAVEVEQAAIRISLAVNRLRSAK